MNKYKVCPAATLMSEGVQYVNAEKYIRDDNSGIVRFMTNSETVAEFVAPYYIIKVPNE